MTMCECGKPADAEYELWNGMHHLPVCEECWRDPENICVEACVRYVEDQAVRVLPDGTRELSTTLEEALRLELGFREIPWTLELQALCDRRYLEWYA